MEDALSADNKVLRKKLQAAESVIRKLIEERDEYKQALNEIDNLLYDSPQARSIHIRKRIIEKALKKVGE